MSFKRSLLALAFAAGLSTGAHAAPLEAYGKLPTIEEVALSPDATRIGMVVTAGDERRIIVRRVSDEAIEASLPIGAAKTRGLMWVGRDHLVITASVASTIKRAMPRKGEYYSLVAFDMRDRKLHPIMDGVDNSVSIISGDPASITADGKRFLMVPGLSFRSGEARSVAGLFKADLETYKVEAVWRGEPQTQRYVFDGQGKVIALAERDLDGLWVLKVRQGEAWRTVRKLEVELDPPVLMGRGATNDSVLVRQKSDEGETYRQISTMDAVWPEPFATLDSASRVQRGPDGRLAWLQDWVGENIRYNHLDPAVQKIWTAVRAAFPGDRVTVASWSDDPGKLVVLVDSNKEGPAYAFVDVVGKKAQWIGGAYQDVLPADIARIEPIHFKASDGLEVSGYLTLPVGREAKNLPLVVLSHGGPDDRDIAIFDWLPQAIASRGYAVLQVNYRGSSGYGRAFLQAGYGEWGRKMQTDISDGVRAMAARGVVDPKRVCIAGKGFGGYTALAGVAFEPGVYRCAVSIAGISNVDRLLEYMNPRVQKWWLRYVGASRATDNRLNEISPALHTMSITAPVLLMHGRDDTVMPIEQTETMAAQLRSSGKVVEIQLLDGEDHWLSRSATRLQALKTLMAFVEKHNPPN